MVLRGDLTQRNRRIFDALLGGYQGDLRKVYQHVQVERLFLSRQYRSGLVTVEPKQTVDARSYPVTGERVIADELCHHVLAVMVTAGLYETSGDWLYQVGQPGKRGIGGVNLDLMYGLPEQTEATFAATLAKTRVNPVIQDSPYLKDMLTDTDNVEVKQLGTSYLYLKGAASSNAPISIPADALVHDELDFSDPLVISQYQSRLTHSPHKFKTKLSTPTIPGKGKIGRAHV